MGFSHILEGIDHLLFLFCLIIPIASIRKLIPVITSFTVGHSITLLCSAFGLLLGAIWFPALIESLIALSIIYMSIENIVGKKLDHRWIAALGLVSCMALDFHFYSGTHYNLQEATFSLPYCLLILVWNWANC